MPITSQSNIAMSTLLTYSQRAPRKDMSPTILKVISRTSDGSEGKTNCLAIKPPERLFVDIAFMEEKFKTQ